MRRPAFTFMVQRPIALLLFLLLSACGRGPSEAVAQGAPASGPNKALQRGDVSGGAHSAPTPSASIEGAFIADDNGSNLLFSRGKVISVDRIRNGTYTTGGDKIVLTRADGTRFNGVRIDATHLRFRMRDDAPVFDVDLYRQDTPEADATLKRLGLPTAAKPPTAALAAPLPPRDIQPDFNVPLSHYKALPTGRDIAQFVAAWSEPMVPDEVLLRDLADGYYAGSDSFKKHDLAARTLPSIHAAITADRGQRAVAIPLTQMFPAASLAQFDFATHTFALRLTAQARATEHDCWYHQGVGSEHLDALIATTNLPCAVRVDDENTARKIEEESGKTNLVVDGTAYLWVIGVADPHGFLPTVLTHAHVMLKVRNTESVLWEQDL